MNLGQDKGSVDSRLKNYSALAGALLAGVSAANAGTWYSGLKNQVLSGDPETYDLVFNGNTRFSVEISGTSSNRKGLVRLAGTTATYGQIMNSKSNVVGLSNGYNISAGRPWGSVGTGALIFAYPGVWIVGNSFAGTEKYIGLKFKIGASVHYGWVRVTVAGDAQTITVHDYAYETVAGDPCTTDNSLPVELASFSANYLNGAVNLAWATESETDNLGYILERKTEDTDWKEIASYATHDALEGAGNTSSRTEYAFTDEDVLPGQSYTYRLSDVDTGGNVTVKDVITIELDEAPPETILKPATPNPFNPATKIVFDIAENTDVTLSVVDMTGRTVQTIIPGQRHSAGSYSIHWNGKTDDGMKAASGMYLLVLKAGSVRKTQKVMLVK